MNLSGRDGIPDVSYLNALVSGILPVPNGDYELTTLIHVFQHQHLDDDELSKLYHSKECFRLVNANVHI